jgi:hypothetical protein
MLYCLKVLYHTQINISKACKSHSGPIEVGIAEVGIAEVGTNEVGTSEIGTVEGSFAEIDIAEVGIAEISIALQLHLFGGRQHWSQFAVWHKS